MAGAGLVYYLGLVLITGCLSVVYFRIIRLLGPNLNLFTSGALTVVFSVLTIYLLKGLELLENNLGLFCLIGIILAGGFQFLERKKSKLNPGQTLGNAIAVISIIVVVFLIMLIIIGLSIDKID